MFTNKSSFAYPLMESGPVRLQYASDLKHVELLHEGRVVRVYERMSAAVKGYEVLSSR